MANRFEATKLLDKATLDQMHQAALTMLEKTGMEVKHPEVLQEIAKRPGFTLSGGRVRISPKKVIEFEKVMVSPGEGDRLEPAYSDTHREYTCAVSDRSAFIVDRDGKTIRPMLKADVIEGCKLVGVLAKQRGLHGPTIGVPTDVPLALLPLEQFMITAEYSPVGGFTSQTSDILTAEIIMEMDRVYGRPFCHDVWSPSPLELSGSGLDILWHFRDKVKYSRMGTMPIMGLTGPCDPISVFTLSVAECLGAGAILHELLPELKISMVPHPEPADMRTGSIVFGTPEWELLDLMHNEVFGYFGISWYKSLHTTSPLPDQQTMIEHATSAMNGMLCGYKHFSPLGQLSLDEVYSPALLMIDLDILENVARIARGVSSGEGLELSGLAQLMDGMIKEGSSFIDHETTVANLRGQYQQPKLLMRMNKGQWEGSGRPDLIQEAQKLADEVTRQYDYEAPRDILKELQSIYKLGRAKLLQAAGQ